MTWISFSTHPARRNYQTEKNTILCNAVIWVSPECRTVYDHMFIAIIPSWFNVYCDYMKFKNLMKWELLNDRTSSQYIYIKSLWYFGEFVVGIISVPHKRNIFLWLPFLLKKNYLFFIKDILKVELNSYWHIWWKKRMELSC